MQLTVQVVHKLDVLQLLELGNKTISSKTVLLLACHKRASHVHVKSLFLVQIASCLIVRVINALVPRVRRGTMTAASFDDPTLSNRIALYI